MISFLILVLDKSIDDTIKIIVNEIVKAYIIGNKLYKTDKEDVIIPKIGHGKVFQAFQLLCNYK